MFFLLHLQASTPKARNCLESFTFILSNDWITGQEVIKLYKLLDEGMEAMKNRKVIPAGDVFEKIESSLSE